VEPVIAILGAGAAIAVWIGVQERRARIDACRRAMDACGVAPGAQWRSLGIPILVEGSAGELAVRMEPRESGEEHAFRIVVGGLPPLTVRRETMGLERHSGAREIVVGDDGFDDEVYVEGAPVAALALLDAETRARLWRVVNGTLDLPGEAPVECKAALFEGHLRLDVTERVLGGVQRRLTSVLRETLGLAAHLAAVPHGAAGLARNAEQDPVAGVRIANLKLLAREFPREERTRAALRAASAEGPDELRLAAALLMGEEGRGTLVDLAFGALEDRCGSEAVRALASSFSAEQAARLLESSLAATRYRTAHACLQRLARGTVQPGPLLLQALRVDDAAVAAAAAGALEAAGDSAAETPLLEALDHPIEGVRVAVAQAVGRVGTARAVLPLKALAEASTYTPVALRRAARQAVAQIQSRLGPAAPGQLTVVLDAGGAVSIASAGGELSPAAEDGG
jgi:hypothetical protein